MLLALVVLLAPAPASSQEFAALTPLPAAEGDLLERGLAPAAGGLAIRALHVRRPLGLATRSLDASLGAWGVRVAGGVSRTGDTELGWSTGAAALGVANEDGGVALRGVVRRDDAALFGEPRLGYEVGGGAWVRWAAARAWASAPQAWLGSAAPPLARGLTAGLDLDAGDCTASLAREAPRRGFAEGAAYVARLGIALGGLALWTEFRDHPGRGGVGVAASAGPLRCSAQVDAHPVLEPTARLAIELRPPRSER